MRLKDEFYERAEIMLEKCFRLHEAPLYYFSPPAHYNEDNRLRINVTFLSVEGLI